MSNLGPGHSCTNGPTIAYEKQIMKRLTAITLCAVILLLSNLKGFDCVNNTTAPAPILILPSCRYPPSTSSNCYGGMTPSELAILSSTDLAPPERVDAIVSMINALPTSPYSLSNLPPQTLCCVLNELARRPSLLKAITPLNVVYLLDTLCASPCLIKFVPDRTICDLITAVVLCPKIVDALTPCTVVGLLSKVSLSTLSPTVRASLIHCALSPKALSTLTLVEISIMIDVLISEDHALAGSMAPADIFELMNTTVLSPTFANNMSAARAVDILCLLSKTTLARSVQRNVVVTLATSFAPSAHRLPATTLARLMAALKCSPFALNSMDPDTVALLLAACSSTSVLSAVTPDVLAQLLLDLSRESTVPVDATIGFLYSVSCASPSLMCNVPTCVWSAYAIRLTSPEVIAELSIEIIIKLIGIICKNRCFMTELKGSSMNMTLTYVASNRTLLNAISQPDIVDLIYAVVDTGCMIREISHEIIQKFLSFLDLLSSSRTLDNVHLLKLLSCISRSPCLMSVLSGTQLVNVLEMMTSAPGASQTMRDSDYLNILIQLITTPQMLSEIPFTTLLNLLKQIQNHSSDNVFCAIPPCVIDEFTEFLGANNALIIASLPPADLIALVDFLTKVRCFFAQLSVKTLSALLEAISAASFVIPLEVKIKLIFAIHQLSPSVLCSLPPESIGSICKSLGSFDALQGDLSNACLGELLTAISTCPCLLSAFDHSTIQDLLECLSTSQSMLSDLEPGDVVNLVISMSFNEPLRTSIPVCCFVRFLHSMNAVTPNSIPPTTAVELLKSLSSVELMMDGLTSMEAANLADLLAADFEFLCAFPTDMWINLLTAITNRFTEMPRESIVHLLAAAHSASPSLLCAVPKTVLANLLDLICTRSTIGNLPSKYLAVFVAVLSTSPCMMDAMSIKALESFLGVLLSQSALLTEVAPPNTFTDLCTILALTPSQHVDVSTIILLLSAAGPKLVCNIPAMALSILLEQLADAKIVYELHFNTILMLLRLAATSPCVLEVLSCPTLNTIMVKVASSPLLIQHLPPDLLQCFIAAVASSRPALGSLRPTTIAHLFTSIADVRPCILSTMSPATVTALLGAFGSQHAFASLPPPALDGLINVFARYSNIFAAMPLSVLNELLQFFVATSTILGSMLSCTLFKFLAMLSSIPQLLRALQPSTLIAFIKALCMVSPKFLCAFPVSIVTALFDAVAAGPALPALTPSTVASLVSALNTSPCLISSLPTPLLMTFLAYLANNPSLLSDTPRAALITVVHNVQSPGSIPPVVFPAGCGLPCVAIDRFSEISANANSSSCLGDVQILQTGNNTTPIIIHPENANGTFTVWCFPKNNEKNPSDGK